MDDYDDDDDMKSEAVSGSIVHTKVKHNLNESYSSIIV